MEPNADLQVPETAVPPLPETHIIDVLGKKFLKKKSSLTDRQRETKYSVEECDITIETAGCKFVLLFFSAGWCHPCNEFLQVLKDFYNEVNIDSKQVEVVYVSSDNDESGFKETYAQMPWLTYSFSNKMHAQLKE